jgi:hypothetical protein
MIVGPSQDVKVSEINWVHGLLERFGGPAFRRKGKRCGRPALGVLSGWGAFCDDESEMDEGRAHALKTYLLAQAQKRGVDLNAEANRWSLWLRSTGRGMAAGLAPSEYRFDFITAGGSAAELFGRVDQDFSYIFGVLDGSLILETRGGESTVREISCAEG